MVAEDDRGSGAMVGGGAKLRWGGIDSSVGLTVIWYASTVGWEGLDWTGQGSIVGWGEVKKGWGGQGRKERVQWWDGKGSRWDGKGSTV